MALPPIESAAERASMVANWDTALVDGRRVACHYAEPGSLDLDISSYDPTLLLTAAEVADVPIVAGTSLTVGTHDGRTLGPYAVRTLQRQEDGAFFAVVLELL